MEELQQKSQGLPIFNISAEGFQELQKSGLTLDQLFYLECKANKVNLRDIVSSDKIATWRQSLIRKGFMTEEKEVSVDGFELLKAVGSGEAFKGTIEKKHESNEAAFEEWWKAYPPSDIFEYKGKRFEGVRAIKRNKTQCKEKFLQVLNEGEYTANDLIRVLEFEVHIKKEESVRRNENQMRYMVNTLSYLNQRLFEGLMELSKGSIISTQSNEDI